MTANKGPASESSQAVSLPGRVLLESDHFPFEFLSELAGRESWRKEIYRPVYHMHKWWATRLGSIFRGILLGCALPTGGDLKDAFYRQHALEGVTVFDPFMGSGTTIGEAHKLGCVALARDINPVAAESVRVALGPLDPDRIHEEFRRLEASVGQRICQLYKAVDENGVPCDVLYFFWVKQVPCLHCGEAVDLFNSRVIARNAFPNRKPEVRICCPGCSAILSGKVHDPTVLCGSCGRQFDPRQGNTQGAKATCPRCHRWFGIVHAVRAAGVAPRHRLIGKLILKSNGDKQYSPATEADREAYAQCERQLAKEAAAAQRVLPSLRLQDGHNTRQALNYGYRSWRDFFNDRQLLVLGWLHNAIAEVDDETSRDALLTIFSSTLEFNNLFASYKGEGTGAVRHMFSHHILKPERLPLEAHVWGTPKSSGAFSGLYRTRLLRAIEYRLAPIEIAAPRSPSRRTLSRRVVQCSLPFTGKVQTAWPPTGPLLPRSIHLSCGSSDATALPDRSIDWIVTDPPFFDNVHYSELADFFLAWQTLTPRGFVRGHLTTRSEKEVQDASADGFAAKLKAVFAECCRVLKDDGLLVFTYHHSRPEGWFSLASAVLGSGFLFVNAHPVKAEMSVATPKARAKQPIQLDVVLVCRKRTFDERAPKAPGTAFDKSFERAVAKAIRLRSVDIDLSRNDRRVILYSQFLTECRADTLEGMLDDFARHQTRLEAALDEPSFAIPSNSELPAKNETTSSIIQPLLFE